MTMKAHLKNRFVRDKPIKVSTKMTLDDKNDYTIRTITEQEESSNFYMNTDNLPSEIHHSGT